MPVQQAGCEEGVFVLESTYYLSSRSLLLLPRGSPPRRQINKHSERHRGSTVLETVIHDYGNAAQIKDPLYFAAVAVRYF